MRKLIFLFILFITTGTLLKAQDVVFKASAPESVVMGQQFRLTFTVNAEGKDLRVQEMPDFEVLMGPSQSKAYSSSWINGKASSETTITYTYILSPKKEGTFNIPPATIKVKNATYSSKGLSIKVLPPDQSSESTSTENTRAATSISANDYFVRMDVSKRNLFEQEGFLVTFKLYAVQPCTLNRQKFPEFEGFLAQEVELPEPRQWVQDRYNNRNYWTVTLRQTVLYPQRSGKITIEGGGFDAVIRLRIQRQGGGSIFDDFFDNSYQNVNKELRVSPVTIDVKPLPSGKPSSFTGSVGSFTMDAQISSNVVKANEAVTVKVKITGSGNVKLIKNPEVKFPNDFDIYDPKVDNSDIRTTAAGVSGSKTIEYMAIPRYPGDFEIPAIEFSYFDIKSGTYKVLTSQPFKLHVDKGAEGEGTAPVVSNFSNKESVKYLGQDIRYLKIKNIQFVPVEELFFGTFMYLMCYLVPAILFIVFFIVYRKQVKENSDLALVRTRKANKIAVKKLKNAGKFLKDNKKEAFYDEILRAVWGYLSDKLNISQSQLTKDNVENELTKYGVSEMLINEFLEILNTCEFARYAPSQSFDTMDKLYEQTVEAISKMENTIKK
ncbi:MAG: BatD family protein [Massilibacteroides sp.]|nr:BatD family protein [Massilibacteroides sp.]MDD3061687.1 BatD family protein [Massilibacteroides sp.]MDD4114395.1 BatD family protein [Massilibacteroides sp.]MDD4660268.1 BatD family protein [Massilibacteroides sp.]